MAYDKTQEDALKAQLAKIREEKQKMTKQQAELKQKAIEQKEKDSKVIDVKAKELHDSLKKLGENVHRKVFWKMYASLKDEYTKPEPTKKK